MMTTPLHIAVIGAGIVGMSVAILLGRQGHRVSVFERHQPSVSQGAGMLLQPLGLDALRAPGQLLQIHRGHDEYIGVLPTGVAIVAVATIGVWQIASGTYIHAKAWLAQQLIASAWMRMLEGEREVKPWPWADTWPIARLQVIDKDVDLYVLADASGRSLAFGPGYVNGTAAIGEGNTVLAGHRDTHFAFLRDLQPGDELAIQTADGRKWRFQLSETHVIDSRHERLRFDENVDATITLLTCYPFDAMTPGGPLRYVAIAGIKPGHT